MTKQQRARIGKKSIVMSSSQAPLLPGATRELARFAAETRGCDLPARVIDR